MKLRINKTILQETVLKRNCGIQVGGGESGQAMVEYVIVATAVMAGALAVNALLIPPLQELYVLITDVISLPIP